MKKTAWTAAAFLAAACMASAPAPVSADDLRLPSGEVLPLGDKVTVWRGSDSYFAGKLNGILEGDDFEQSMAQAVIDRGVYKESERAEAEQFAKETAELWRDSRVYQLRSVSGNTMYTAFVLSLPIDTAYWQAEAEDHRWEEYTEVHGVRSLPAHRHGILAGGSGRSSVGGVYRVGGHEDAGDCRRDRSGEGHHGGAAGADGGRRLERRTSLAFLFPVARAGAVRMGVSHVPRRVQHRGDG